MSAEINLEVHEMEKRHIINTYNRVPHKSLFIVKGEGCWVWDEKGKKYLDFLSGLGVNSLGHCHPAVVDAVRKQTGKLLHTSNLYYTEPQSELASLLAHNSFGEKVFFCNSGAEANEAAIKLARKYAKKEYGSHKYKIITAKRSFHGRTLATVTATAQEKYHKGFQPLPEGFFYGDFNDISSFHKLMDKETCAVMVEPVQGEGGVYPADKEFLSSLRKLCNKKGVLLIFDEVQCGMGRTGSLWAYENYGVEPDILTAAKALGGGLPIGAMIATDKVASGFTTGDHASTFGGNPVSCGAAIAVLDTLLKEGFLFDVKRKSGIIKQFLNDLKFRESSFIKEIRGEGLMLAIELNEPLAASIKDICQEKGLLINAIGDSIIRFLPPLIIKEKEIDFFFSAFREGVEEARSRNQEAGNKI